MYTQLRALLSAAEVQQVRQLLASDVWASGRVTAGSQSVQVKNNWQAIETHPQVEQARAIIQQALGRHAVFFSAALPKRVFPPLFNRYAGAHNAFGDHIDNAVRTPATGGAWVRTDLSCTVFLTEPQAYEGGELIIQDGLSGQSVKLPAGDAILYPASTVHRVEPVVRGERLACFFWVESMVRSQDQRQSLHQMDKALSSLRQQHGESAETVALTGVYHNLMRQWVDLQ